MTQCSALTRYAFIGCGDRIGNFIHPLLGRFSHLGEPVALMDLSRVRMNAWNEMIAEQHRAAPVACYVPDEWEKMLKEARPDYVVIASTDATHHDYILQALDAGCKVITEKPMTIDGDKCRQIFAAVDRNQAQHDVRVTFNYRWSDANTQVKDLLLSGVIGRVLSVNLDYVLDTAHGADYFRRWHSNMSQSGGLLVHKSTHHFDLVNWWLDAIPEQVHAHGDLVFYGKDNAIQRGQAALTRYDRYTGEAAAADDPYALDLVRGVKRDENGSETLQRLYLDAEAETGYLRDRNVFREGIDIYDTISALVRYRDGRVLNYSLNAFSSREGMRVALNGEKGRIEFHHFGVSHLMVGEIEQADQKTGSDVSEKRILVFPHFKAPYEVPFAEVKEGHGGADPRLRAAIYDPQQEPDPLGRDAGHEQGAASILIGICANRSIREGRPVKIDEELTLRPEATRLSELI